VTILKVPRLWPALQVGREATFAQAAAAPAHAPVDGLDAFGSESEPETAPKVRIAPPPPSPRTPIKTPKWLRAAAMWAAVVVVTAAVAVAGVFLYQKRFTVGATSGTVTMETTPSGLDVMLAGKSLGKTPLTTTLAPGAYELQVGSAPSVRTVKVNVTAGSSVVQRIEFAGALSTSAAVTGGLRVQTEPSRLAVFVDGTQRGVSPLELDQLSTGEHEVSVRTSTGVVRRAVTIQPRQTVALIISSTPPPAEPTVAAGWISITAPIALQMKEGGKLIGSSESDRLMLHAGDHDIEFSNETVGFSARRTLRVAAGKTVIAKIDMPNGSLSLNAQPWAEVFVDGERVGETPIGNLSRRVGTHEVVFKHPELGERKETVTIAVGKPARLAVDLRKK